MSSKHYNQLTKLLVKLRKNKEISKNSYWLLSTKIINIYNHKLLKEV